MFENFFPFVTLVLVSISKSKEQRAKGQLTPLFAPGSLLFADMITQN